NMAIIGAPDFYAPMLASVDGTAGWTFEKGVLVAGRRADVDSADEVALSEEVARRLGVGVGDVAKFASVSTKRYSCARVEECEFLTDGPEVSLRVVGIVRNSNDLV